MPLTIEEVRSLGDPQRSYKWEVILPSIKVKRNEVGLTENLYTPRSSPTLFVTGREAVGIIDDRGDRDIGGGTHTNTTAVAINPSLLVEEVQGLPFSKISSEAFYEGGSNTYFPGLKDIDRVTMVFFQNESNDIVNYIQSWKDLITNRNGTKNLPKNYKYTILTRLLNGRNRPVLAYRLHGAFPTTTTPYDLNNSSERLTLTQEFSVDYGELIEVASLKSSQLAVFDPTTRAV